MKEQGSETTEWRVRSPFALGSVIKSVLLQVFLISIPVGVVLWFVDRWQNNPGRLNMCSMVVVSATAAMLTSAWGVIVHRRFWSGPTRELMCAIEQAQRGEVAIEELSQIDGGIQPLVKLVQELLRNQKEQKVHLAELEEEMRGRIANRTDALERKIGSLKHQAMRDALTGLWNRRSLEQEIQPLVVAYQSNDTDACLLMMDVDNFKLLNDTLGHRSGDQLLKEIGQIIRSTIRETDKAFRCGGDEFVVLLGESSLSNMNEICQRLESLVEVLARPLHLPVPPRLSIGACCLSELEMPTREAWLEVADKRLYDVKASRKGRSRNTPAPAVKKSA